MGEEKKLYLFFGHNLKQLRLFSEESFESSPPSLTDYPFRMFAVIISILILVVGFVCADGLPNSNLRFANQDILHRPGFLLLLILSCIYI